MTLYRDLGLEDGCDDPEKIKRAHRRLIKAFHPDINKDAGASARFRSVQAAYEVLSDPQKRAKYEESRWDQDVHLDVDLVRRPRPPVHRSTALPRNLVGLASMLFSRRAAPILGLAILLPFVGLGLSTLGGGGSRDNDADEIRVRAYFDEQTGQWHAVDILKPGRLPRNARLVMVPESLVVHEG